MANFIKGQRVIVKAPEPWEGFKLGTVVYQRMKAPQFSEVEAVSVLLDEKKAASQKPPFPSYSGTIFPAEQVFPMISPERAQEIYQHMQYNLDLSKKQGKEETPEEKKQLNFLWTLCPGYWSFYDVVASLAHKRSVPPEGYVQQEGTRKAIEKLIKEEGE